MTSSTQARLTSPSALLDHVGEELAVGEWVEISQQRIEQFAEATDDRQWIHLDPARAAAESPYGGTIAHGLLTLSLVVPLVERAVAIDGVRMTVNYGFDRVRFPSAVPSGARVRARVAVAKAEALGEGVVHVVWTVTIEREGGGDRPALLADWIARLLP